MAFPGGVVPSPRNWVSTHRTLRMDSKKRESSTLNIQRIPTGRGSLKHRRKMLVGPREDGERAECGRVRVDGLYISSSLGPLPFAAALFECHRSSLYPRCGVWRVETFRHQARPNEVLRRLLLFLQGGQGDHARRYLHRRLAMAHLPCRPARRHYARQGSIGECGRAGVGRKVG